MSETTNNINNAQLSSGFGVIALIEARHLLSAHLMRLHELAGMIGDCIDPEDENAAEWLGEFQGITGDLVVSNDELLLVQQIGGALDAQIPLGLVAPGVSL